MSTMLFLFFSWSAKQGFEKLNSIFWSKQCFIMWFSLIFSMLFLKAHYNSLYRYLIYPQKQEKLSLTWCKLYAWISNLELQNSDHLNNIFVYILSQIMRPNISKSESLRLRMHYCLLVTRLHQSSLCNKRKRNNEPEMMAASFNVLFFFLVKWWQKYVRARVSPLLIGSTVSVCVFVVGCVVVVYVVMALI